MQLEKKLILCSILAISIGIATIIPLQYLMNAEATTEMPNVEPYFNVDIEYAECNPYQVGNRTTTWDGATIQAVANFTLTANAMEPDVNTQVEYYKFSISTDQGPIGDVGYYIAESETTSADIAAIEAGICNGTKLNGNATITFKNGISYNPPNEDQIISWSGKAIGWTGGMPLNSTYGIAYLAMSANNTEDSVYPVLPQAVAQLRDAQTISIDVSKICTVTVKGNVVVTTPADSTILQHIELTKTDNGFVYGTYTEGTVPYFHTTLP